MATRSAARAATNSITTGDKTDIEQASAGEPIATAPAASLEEDSPHGAREAPDARDGREAADAEPSKRRMPDKVRRFLLRMQGGKYYLPAAYRIVWFRDELGDDWGIRTTLLEGGHEAGFATVQAEIVNPAGRVIASDMKTETKQDFPAGWVEKASTGAVARALALLGFGTQFMPELDDDGFRPADSPRERPNYAQPYAATRTHPEHVREDAARPVSNAAASDGRPQPAPASEIWEGPGQCPRCHAPEGKRHGKVCLGG